MFSLYKQLTTKYPHCVFGYVEGPGTMQLSVVSKKYKSKNTRMRIVELEKVPQYYANQFMEMIWEIHGDHVPAQRS